MSVVQYGLSDEFPKDTDTIHALKLSSSKFRRLAGQYQNACQEIHRIETGLQDASDVRTENMKKIRLRIIDKAAKMIADNK
jgi:uncharacterized protein YdcH (DUF465 family)